MNNIIFKTIMLKGEKGNDIVSIEKTATAGNIDTYTITMSDGSTETFEVTNGSSIASIEKTATSGLVDTYTVTLTDGTTTTFEVTNGEDAQLYELPTNAVVGYDTADAVPDGYTEISSPYDAALSNSSDNAPQTQAVKAALDLKAPINNPVFTGNPKGTTRAANNNSSSLATTEYVDRYAYHVGDTVDLNGVSCVGYLTTGQTAVRLFVPLDKPVAPDVTGVTLSNNGTWEVRHSDGGYIVQSATLQSKGTVTCAIKSVGVLIALALTTASSLSNNAVVVGAAFSNAKLTFT